MSTEASALETGQFALAVSACSSKAAGSIPGTSASVTSAILVMPKPASVLSRYTLAVVSTRVGVNPALARPLESAIEKQPAWAAAMSSSGLVPAPSSKRELNEYCPSNAPPPKRIVPLPLGRSPSHRASALRTGIRQTSLNPLYVIEPDAIADFG